MLGTVRFSLAVLVVANHLWLPVANKVGAHAVVSFYIISGYLMTLVLHSVYPATFEGRLRFLSNRVLRIYPTYWFVVGLTILGLFLFPTTFKQIYSLIVVPGNFLGWFQNLTLWQLTDSSVIVVPPAWSLWVEFCFYVAMGLGLVHSRLTVHVWFAVSFAVTVYLLASGQSFADRYYPIHAASLFFSIGALLYVHKEKFEKIGLRPVPLGVAIVAFLGWPVWIESVGLDPHVAGFYGSVPLFLYIVLSMLNGKFPPTVRSIDSKLGDLAYPVFLTHFFCSGLVRMLPIDLSPLGLPFFLVSLAVTVVVSLAILRYFDPIINGVRDTIRGVSADRKDR